VSHLSTISSKHRAFNLISCVTVARRCICWTLWPWLRLWLASEFCGRSYPSRLHCSAVPVSICPFGYRCVTIIPYWHVARGCTEFSSPLSSEICRHSFVPVLTHITSNIIHSYVLDAWMALLNNLSVSLIFVSAEIMLLTSFVVSNFSCYWFGELNFDTSSADSESAIGSG
jgi:hypothetical protein